MNILKHLWADEVGAILSAELILMGTLLVIGLIVGLATLRDHVIQEVADIAGAIGDLNQSFSYSSVTGHNSLMIGASFTDLDDACDRPGNNDGNGVASGTANSQCVNVNVNPEFEGNAAP
jgi:hypothetical protein